MHNTIVDKRFESVNTVRVNEHEMHKALPKVSGEYLSPQEVAVVVPGASAMAVRRWAAAGDLPGAIRLPSGRWQIPWSAVVGILGFDPRVAGSGDGAAASDE